MRLSGFQLPVDHLSATSLSVAITCPEQFRLRYLKHEPERLNIQKLVGSAFHGAIADNWRWKLHSGDDLPEQVALERLMGAWDDTIEREGEPEWKEPPQQLFSTSSLMLQTYLQDYAPAVTPLSAEQRVEEQVPGIPVPVVGVVDCETRSRILETKTTPQKVTTPKPRWRLQARLYQLMIRKPVSHQIVTRQKTPKIYTEATEPGLLTPVADPDQTVLILQRAVAVINDYYARWGADQPWPPNGIFHDWLCSYCPYPRICVAWEGTRGPKGDWDD